jgi:hypothetical protein
VIKIEAEFFGQWLKCTFANNTVYCSAGPVSKNVKLKVTGDRSSDISLWVTKLHELGYWMEALDIKVDIWE